MYRKMNEGVTPGPAERGVIAGGAAVTVMAAIQPLEVCCRRMQASPVPDQALNCQDCAGAAQAFTSAKF